MPLYDTHKRLIDYLRISVTDRCNLSCFYCKPRAAMKTLSHREILSYEEIIRLVALAVPLGISRVRVTGGEPLVRRGIIDFIASLHSIEGLQDISITTNGVLLEEMAEGLISAGKLRLNVSLDSLKPGTFRQITGSDNFDRVWRGINRAEELGFSPIKINMVPVRGMNDTEAADFARLTLDRKLHVRFIEYMPIGADKRWYKDACIPSSEIRAVIEREVGPLKPFCSGNSAGPSDNYQLPDAQGVIGFISPITRHFCESCRRLRLTADGKLKTCLFSDEEIDLKEVLRNGGTDDDLREQLLVAIRKKPERHPINTPQFKKCQRHMSAIGG